MKNFRARADEDDDDDDNDDNNLNNNILRDSQNIYKSKSKIFTNPKHI